MRALLSVWNKSGLEEFARGLEELGFELVASGGTAAYLEELGLEPERVEDLTETPELLGGRVKTLHPRIHAAILARRDRDADLETLERQEIRPFDLVCVNLYPFEQVAARWGVSEEDAVELIDIGGPSLLRGAAKNFAHVAPVCRPEQYPGVLAELGAEGRLSVETRRRLATEAFATTAAYEATIASWFADRDTFPATITASYTKVADLVYGENPHQRAAFYAEVGARTHVLSMVRQVAGKDLSFNNVLDLNSGRLLVDEFEVPACAIIKHNNPCGVAIGSSGREAYERALACDPQSAFGGVVCLNRPVDRALAEVLLAQFCEVLFAPRFADDALALLESKPAMRVLEDNEQRRFDIAERDLKRVMGGLLVQDRDIDLEDRSEMQVVTERKPTEGEWGEMLFGWKVCKHVRSNAIVLSRELASVGIGAGQMSRVDSVRLAVEKAREVGTDLQGSALASDAFFPFADGPALAVSAGVTSIIQPGGSKRDPEVVEAADAAGISMVFTHRRHFRH